VVLALGGLLPGASVAEQVSPSAVVSSEPDLRPLGRRSSFDMRLAFRQSAPSGFRINGLGIASSSPREQVSLGLGFSHWLKEDLAVTFAAAAQAGELEMAWDAERGEFVETRGLVSLLVGVRRYVGGTPKIRPYLAAAAGPYIGGTSVTSNGSSGRAWTRSRPLATFGGHFGGGVALRVGRSWMVDLSAGYNLTSDFSRPVSGRGNYNGFELGVGVGWLFGGGESQVD
jgi:hypothetical protein